ncbi:MAG: sn-glycerol-3-phosphate ABC transporter permease UgpA [Alphaproteobacteria bacterium]|jgi:sn-glycerol 3-phosphate transport system permease protein|uniref:sn-glycerol-3-phosphate transport system permease protein UgpA n=1 Tax=Pseudorhizobium pelagicum TaxID=1509405 RepID=A0A922NYF0_9HYPH|nr:sn-glycerol-3-phosphate ABC transporter permease UgpA [Pseudorhizobium pelagicum]MBU1313505.1 sn-glycerol-3-phosphate ABC transporter permease UgpA [Alphaproteobacteria bacterium]KEQ03957.1 glycerol-3-phosphate transporter permease [Pseudorhizobium pelagicum]KEQ04559.1 glycerol-3-phosphate transporter permease [Pseudorhizobium pelagicum]MBU1549670.1 sn-glycerol-3-phosphate ABC transporter permease UgpA [Alphaproteobacteria bacterium]MBU2335468.1 sn-glycerol-3-phosphate ABC transporter perme|tara:strand:- start:103 stop:987 length:885 start_codon:yes stop_codon:yes gene_type:complete
METKKTTFDNRLLPYLLLAPQLFITLVFFIWPAAQAVKSSFEREDPFGLSTAFVGLLHYQRLLSDPEYLAALSRTGVFAVSVTVLSMVLGLAFAAAVDRLTRTGKVYTTLLVWPYAVAPVVAGILWWFLFNSTTGLMPFVLEKFGIDWDHDLNGTQAMILIIVAAAWKQISYNFLFFLAGLQSVPQSLMEAAAIDGSGPVKRFFTISLPLISPTTFFLFIINVNYTMFDTFPIIDATTVGGPAQATTTLVYKVYQDGYIGLNLGSSSAQSVLLMMIVMVLTYVQFRFVERRVQY